MTTSSEKRVAKIICSVCGDPCPPGEKFCCKYHEHLSFEITDEDKEEGCDLDEDGTDAERLARDGYCGYVDGDAEFEGKREREMESK